MLQLQNTRGVPDWSRKQSRMGLIFHCVSSVVEKTKGLLLFLAHSQADQCDFSVVQVWGLHGELIQVKK